MASTQVESFAVVLGRLVEEHERAHAQQQGLGAAARPLHVVDFGCGTGAVLLPLAHLFPQCIFTGRGSC